MRWKVKMIWSNGKTYERQQCTIWARCMGYLAPINRFNIWKKSEFYSRKYFKIVEWVDDIISNNKAFIAKYSTNVIPIT